MWFESMPEKNLIPGQSYAIEFKIKNSSNFKINEGKYIIALKNVNGVEEFRKEVTSIAFNEMQELSFFGNNRFFSDRKGKA